MDLPRKRLLLAVCVVTVIAIFGLWLIARRAPMITRLLPDGSTLTLKQVSYETPYRIRTGDRWQDYLGATLPTEWARKLGARFAVVGTETNATTVYLEWQNSPTSYNLRATAFDEHGCEFGLTSPYTVSVGGGRDAVVFEFQEFPRNAKTVGIRVFLQQPGSIWSKLTEFPVANPAWRSVPSWQGESLPITKSVDGVEFTLRSVRTGITSRTWPPTPPVSGEYRGAWFDFSFTEKGKPAADWQLVGIGGISDGCGNKLKCGSSSSSGNPGEVQIVVDGGLCDQATVWKVDAQFARSRDFPVEDLWTIQSVPVPAPGALTSMDVVTNRHGTELHFRGIHGAGSKAGRNLPGRPACAQVVFTNLSQTIQFQFVSAVDDRGRDVMGSSSSDDYDHYYALKLPADSRTVDFTFVITKRINVEYLVQPSRLSPAEVGKFRKRLGYGESFR